MRWGGCMAWTIGICALLIAAGLWYSRSHVYRYRIAVEVDTPAGVRSGSAVREIRWSRLPTLTSESHSINVKQTGEAVAVDLPAGKTLFVLVGDANETILAGFFSIVGGKGAMGALLKEADSTRQVYTFPSRDVLRRFYLGSPRFVAFNDPSDPLSVIEFDPANPAATLGPGYSIKRVTIQMTDEPVSRGIRKRLPWLSSYPEPSLNPRHGPEDWSLPATLTHGDFSRS